jgi:hypothetical protein
MADNRVLADIARKGGSKLLNAAIDTLLPVDAEKLPPKRKSLLGAVAGSVAVKVATRSVPGAIVVGGAVLAKRLYDKRHAKDSGKAGPKA